MEQHYREHVVGYDTRYDHKSKEWTGAAQVRFSEGAKFCIVAVPVPGQFKSKEEADEASISAARNWIDNRTQSSSSSPWASRPLFKQEKVGEKRCGLMRWLLSTTKSRQDVIITG
jgi:hypothetical protein